MKYIIAFILRIILVPIAITFASIFWILIGIFNPKELGKVLIKTGENLLK